MSLTSQDVREIADAGEQRGKYETFSKVLQVLKDNNGIGSNQESM